MLRSSGLKGAVALLFIALGLSPASATTLNVSVGQDFGDFANSYYTVDATFVLPVGFSNAVLNTSLFAADDRAVLQLNGTSVSETGIFGPGSGSFYFLPDGSDNAAYNFRYGNGTLTSIPLPGPLSWGPIRSISLLTIPTPEFPVDRPLTTMRPCISKGPFPLMRLLPCPNRRPGR
jgi:hypothetical protein